MCEPLAVATLAERKRAAASRPFLLAIQQGRFLACALRVSLALFQQAFLFLVQQTSYLLGKLQELVRILLDDRLCTEFAPAFARCASHQGKFAPSGGYQLKVTEPDFILRPKRHFAPLLRTKRFTAVGGRTFSAMLGLRLRSTPSMQ